MFKTHQENIPQIKATIKGFGQCWFHGCGNLYADEQASDFRQKFTNPNSEEAGYRVHFTSIDQVPATVEELNKKLMASRSQEIVKEKMPKSAQSIKTIKVETEPQHDEDAEFKRLLAEENATKAQ